jgi:hypothetical protein
MYQYTDCYLDNVWLVNGYTLKNTADDEFVEVEAVDELHEVMMNMEVGSILNTRNVYVFEFTNSGWVQCVNKKILKKVA